VASRLAAALGTLDALGAHQPLDVISSDRLAGRPHARRARARFTVTPRSPAEHTRALGRRTEIRPRLLCHRAAVLSGGLRGPRRGQHIALQEFLDVGVASRRAVGALGLVWLLT
jgi:hypothetical protein